MRLATRRGTGPRTAPWLLTAVVLAVLSGAIAWGLGTDAWHSRMSVTIVPPQTDTASAAGQNPLLRLDDDVAALAPVLAAAMHTGSAATTLRQQDAPASFTISTDTSTLVPTRTPVLQFTTQSATPAAARRTAAALVSVARDQLDLLQTRAEVPGAARATLVVVLAPTPATHSDDRRWTLAGRAALAAAIVVALAYLARRGLTGLRAPA